jgi:hypothetical protein
LLLALLAFQLIAGLVRRLRGPTHRRQKDAPDKSPDASQDYSDLTPYEIEDADYEELPRRED